MWDGIIYPFLIFNGGTAEDLELKSNLMPYFILDAITMLWLKFIRLSKRGPWQLIDKSAKGGWTWRQVWHWWQPLSNQCLHDDAISWNPFRHHHTEGQKCKNVITPIAIYLLIKPRPLQKIVCQYYVAFFCVSCGWKQIHFMDNYNI